MARLRLYHSTTPARIYEIINWDEFDYHGEVRIRFTYNGEFKDFTLGYTKPYLNVQEGIFANVINLNQYGPANDKTAFKEWQDPITMNGTIEIDILDFKYNVISGGKSKNLFHRLIKVIKSVFKS